jgi:hypothetical protein
VRDAGAHLHEAIESLAAQTMEDFEVVAVDDGSTDGSAEALDAWARRDRRVRVLRQEPSGIVAALERARTQARGPYLARMDADDVSHPERLARQLALMEASPDLVGCGCRVEYFPREAVRDGARRYERWLNASATPDEIACAIFVECPLAHPTFFLRAAAVEAVGGYRREPWPEDYDLLLRLWAAGGRLAKVPETLLFWREGPERLSRTDPTYGAEAFVACKAHHLARTLLSGGRPAVIWGAGPVGKRFARALAPLGVRVEAFVELDPRKIGQSIHGAPVVDTGAGLGIRGPLHLAAVGQPGARRRLEALLAGAGLRPLEDFAAVA